ncbi:MAG: hypothetical protein A2W17_08665 [Planctomycetes bacterium RBG_16_41_13]|nr:MAG: hypothetical protein A2W17_08665 [Planctomycetes bacterium RBG_16_41_13]
MSTKIFLYGVSRVFLNFAALGEGLTLLHPLCLIWCGLFLFVALQPAWLQLTTSFSPALPYLVRVAFFFAVREKKIS